MAASEPSPLVAETVERLLHTAQKVRHAVDAVVEEISHEGILLTRPERRVFDSIRQGTLSTLPADQLREGVLGVKSRQPGRLVDCQLVEQVRLQMAPLAEKLRQMAEVVYRALTGDQSAKVNI